MATSKRRRKKIIKTKTKREIKGYVKKYTKIISTANQRLGRLHKGGLSDTYAYSKNKELAGKKSFIKTTKSGVVRFSTAHEFEKLTAAQQKEAYHWVANFLKLETSTVKGAKLNANRVVKLLREKATKNTFIQSNKLTAKKINEFWKIYRETARDTADIIYEEIKDVVENSNILLLSPSEQEKIVDEFVKFANRDYNIEKALKRHKELKWN